MARSNKELSDLALVLGSELGVSVQLDGLKNDGLEALVADLEKQKAEKPAAPLGGNVVKPIDGAADNSLSGIPAEPAPAAPVAPPGSVSVALGTSIVCLRGHLFEGTVVTAADLGEGDAGKEALADLMSRGALVKS